MATEKQTAANRRNAQRSTGPRSKAGKARSSRNALKHGLARALVGEPGFDEEVSRLARAIAGERQADAAVLAAATTVAEAELDLMRVRMARVQFLERLKSHPDGLQPPRKLRLRLIKRILAKKYGPPSQAAKAEAAMWRALASSGGTGRPRSGMRPRLRRASSSLR